MLNQDPILHIEQMVKEIHDSAGKYSKPAFKRYPLSFTLLITFSVAAILHGFQLWTDDVSVFHEHPWLLILIGTTTLILTGNIYRALKRGE